MLYCLLLFKMIIRTFQDVLCSELLGNGGENRLNLGLFLGFAIYNDTMPQIDKACEFLRELGFKKIVIAQISRLLL